ncbi:glycoside hydrolase family 43 protein [Paenibacillus aurantiacus]|uniref:Glycoside hydrolase family 43 protein n=1 Tax=Paenibacillus aurantiacus TaxID=1936118 RepID=A0ABV5KRZ6_9BACL
MASSQTFNRKPDGGYLFAHFIGEQEDGEQIYFALSKDGLNWEDLNGNKPILYSTLGERGVRDPYLIRGAHGDKFYMIATDLCIYHRGGWTATEPTVTGSRSIVIWESSDLANWSEPWMAEVAAVESGCAWAPEAIYNEEEDNYLVFWASSRDAVDGNGRGMHVYYSLTRDFRTFTDAEIYITTGERSAILDTTIIKVGSTYYRASCAKGQIIIESSKRLLGEWKNVSTLESLGFGLTSRDVEGPAFYKFNGIDQWGLIVDQFAIEGGYLPLITTDIGDSTGASWRRLTNEDYCFGQLKKRHGSILPLTQSEFELMAAKWGARK